MATLPCATPVTTPVVLTVATDALLELHTPPEVASTRVIEEPTQVSVGPVMVPAEGAGATVIACVSIEAPQLEVRR